MYYCQELSKVKNSSVTFSKDPVEFAARAQLRAVLANAFYRDLTPEVCDWNCRRCHEKRKIFEEAIAFFYFQLLDN